MPPTDSPSPRPPGTTPPPPPSRVVAVVLAAGGGERFQASLAAPKTGDESHSDGAPTDEDDAHTRHKLLSPLPAGADRPAEPVVARALAAAAAADVGPVVVVTGAAELTDVVATLEAELGNRFHVVHHAAWADGQLGSVRAGIAAATALGAERVVVGLGDQPGVTPAAWRAVAAHTGSPIAVATYGGRRGNPVALTREAWELLPDRGDEGARTVMRLHPELVSEVPCNGSPADIDTVEDLRRWQNN